MCSWLYRRVFNVQDNVKVSLGGNKMDKLSYIREALEGHDIDMLKSKAVQLKGTDGEGWSIGEMLERVLSTMDGV